MNMNKLNIAVQLVKEGTLPALGKLAVAVEAVDVIDKDGLEAGTASKFVY